MLTKLEKTILATAVKLTSNNEEICIRTQDITSANPNYDNHRIYLACKELNDKGYFGVFSAFLDGTVSFTLSNKGYCYKEISLLEVKDFLFRSVFTPILVSATTTFIIWLMQNTLR